MDTDMKANVTEAMPQRERNWDELGIEERVERMRQIIKGQDEQLSRLKRDLYNLKLLFKSHSHADGAIVIPIAVAPEQETYYSLNELGREVRKLASAWF